MSNTTRLQPVIRCGMPRMEQAWAVVDGHAIGQAIARERYLGERKQAIPRRDPDS